MDTEIPLKILVLLKEPLIHIPYICMLCNMRWDGWANF